MLVIRRLIKGWPSLFSLSCRSISSLVFKYFVFYNDVIYMLYKTYMIGDIKYAYVFFCLFIFASCHDSWNDNATFYFVKNGGAMLRTLVFSLQDEQFEKKMWV